MNKFDDSSARAQRREIIQQRKRIAELEAENRGLRQAIAGGDRYIDELKNSLAILLNGLDEYWEGLHEKEINEAFRVLLKDGAE